MQDASSEGYTDIFVRLTSPMMLSAGDSELPPHNGPIKSFKSSKMESELFEIRAQGASVYEALEAALGGGVSAALSIRVVGPPHANLLCLSLNFASNLLLYHPSIIFASFSLSWRHD